MQDTFDTVVRHLFAQGKQAHEYGVCRYRTYDGLKCAVGCLIPDEDYDPSFEGQLVDRLPIKLPHTNLLGELQDAHDNIASWQSPNSLVRRLAAIARYSTLNTDALEEAFNNAHW
ncbi:hypothetical protein ACUN0C_18670 [Faunimonas sp. B44]|uniref:hypothetical protein n=1 Tax=Faunimonas sp. B44 TaxID=3461493 RepID=UPI00404504C9